MGITVKLRYKVGITGKPQSQSGLYHLSSRTKKSLQVNPRYKVGITGEAQVQSGHYRLSSGTKSVYS